MTSTTSPTSMPSALLSAVQQKKRELEETRKAFAAELQTSFSSIFKEFFAAHPEVVAIKWRQYTPYFNDGEPCEFRVCDPELFFAGMFDENDRYDEGYGEWNFRGGKKYVDEEHVALMTDQLSADFLAISEIVTSDDDTMLMIFGDHAEVTATPNGIDVDEYDHD